MTSPASSRVALIAELERQEEALQLARLDNRDAWRLGTALVSYAEQRELPVTVDVCRNGHQLFHAALTGTAPENDDWIARKVRTVQHFGASSYLVAQRFLHDGRSFGAAEGIDPLRFAAAGGSFPLRLRSTGIIGAVTVSGLAEEDDHAMAVIVLEQHLRGS